MAAEPPTDDRTERLERTIRGLRWLAFWALLLGLGIGFYAGYVVGLDMGRTPIPGAVAPAG